MRTMKLVVMILIFNLMIVILLSLLPLLFMRINLLMWRVAKKICLCNEMNALCDGYILKFIHDATENYYERGTYAFKYCNNIKFPLCVESFEVMLVLPSYAS